MNRFDQALGRIGRLPLTADGLRTIQVNVGLMCNQSCRHCHLSCSPERMEIMAWETMQLVCRLAGSCGADVVDITGGEPALHADLERFVSALASTGIRVKVRTNFTGMMAEGSASLPELLRDHNVEVIGSLPCYLPDNVDRQRGDGAYARSVEGLRRLNALGYGQHDGYPLSLVHNPAGAYLPGDQVELEAEYRDELESIDISFTRLLTIANMPIGRFAAELAQEGNAKQYMTLLEDSFNPATVDDLMCRHQISVRWDGGLYDCDFNLAMDCPVNHGSPRHIADFDAERLAMRCIATGDHCFGCTAGSGSSCGGALR